MTRFSKAKIDRIERDKKINEQCRVFRATRGVRQWEFEMMLRRGVIHLREDLCFEFTGRTDVVTARRSLIALLWMEKSEQAHQIAAAMSKELAGNQRAKEMLDDGALEVPSSMPNVDLIIDLGTDGLPITSEVMLKARS